MNRNEVMDILNFRHACKEFDVNKTIDCDDLKVILEGGRLAPSSVGIEPWHFIVVENKEFKDLLFDALVYVPLSEWTLNDINLRPFLLMSEIEKSLKNKRIESLGTIDYLGFNLHLVTDLMSCYRMRFSINVYN